MVVETRGRKRRRGDDAASDRESEGSHCTSEMAVATHSPTSVTIQCAGNELELDIPGVRDKTHTVKAAEVSADGKLAWVILEARFGASVPNAKPMGVYASVYALPSGEMVGETGETPFCDLCEVHVTLHVHPEPGRTCVLVESAAGQDGVEVHLLRWGPPNHAGGGPERSLIAAPIRVEPLPGYHVICIGWNPAGDRVALVGHDDNSIWIVGVSKDDAGVKILRHETRDTVCREALERFLSMYESDTSEAVTALRECRDEGHADGRWATGMAFEVVDDHGFFIDMHPGEAEVLLRIHLTWDLAIDTSKLALSPEQY